MAILLAKDLDTGITVEYWKIDSLSIDVVLESVNILYRAYKDEDTRRDGKNPISDKKFYFTGEEFIPFSGGSFTMDELISEAYDITKNDPFFSGGIDC